MRPPRLIVEHQSQLPAVFAHWLAETVEVCLRSRGQASLALPGGSVAEAFLPALAELPLDWERLHVFWGDERAVPPDDPLSNHALAERLLLGPARVPRARVHRMPAERAPLQRAAHDYSEQMLRVLGDPPALDVALLGLGPDGHVCSLFPNHAALEDSAWVTMVTDSPKPPARRLTLTLRTLSEARHVVIGALGRAKAAIVRDVLDDESSLPGARVLAGSQQGLMVLDFEAASLLPARQ